ncbi:hypothetical protein [Psychrobacter fulvigenes]|uniref:hypothetical protein n=1 Tax=Psychrobacter fulvigenes TaxID=533323 RepID=UPI001917C109|nr:hypothetical protein [Psychrobacter fulvigenes]
MSQPYTTYSSGFATESPEAANAGIKRNTKKRKKFAVLSSDEIIDLLKKAHGSREYRKKESNSKNSSTFKLNKESNAILIKLSEQLKATPKKAVEALIKSANLEDRHELLKISKHISGRRSSKKELTKPGETIEAVAPEKTIEAVAPEKTIEAIEPEETAKLEQLDKLEELEEKIINEEDSHNPLQQMQKTLKKNNNNQMDWNSKSRQLTANKHKYKRH